MLAFEKLHRAFVLFGRLLGVERAQVPALARRWINFS
jgi:hypothetical protein